MKVGKNTLDFESKINHNGVVYKARAAYNSYNLIATKSDGGQVHIFDFSKHSMRIDNFAVKPQIVLKGHEREGWGLDWSMQDHELISSDDSGKICIWDIQNSPTCPADNQNPYPNSHQLLPTI